MPIRGFGAPTPYRTYRKDASVVWSRMPPPFDVPPGAKTRTAVDRPVRTHYPEASATFRFTSLLTNVPVEGIKRFFDTPSGPRLYYLQNSFVRGTAGADVVPINPIQPPFPFITTEPPRYRPALSADQYWQKFLAPAEGYDPASGGAFFTTAPWGRPPARIDALVTFRPQILVVEGDQGLRTFVSAPGQHYRQPHAARDSSQVRGIPPLAGVGPSVVPIERVFATTAPRQQRGYFRIGIENALVTFHGPMNPPGPTVGPGIYIPVLRRRRR